MDIKLVSEDRELYKLCREILNEIPGHQWTLSAVASSDGQPGADLYLWDFYPGIALPAVFYAVPIVLTVWRCRSSTAILMAILSGFVWWVADYETGHPYSSLGVQIYEVADRFVFFLLMAGAGLAVKRNARTADERIALLEENRRLEHEIIEISEYEHQRIGQELHDGLCQYLAAIRCTAQSLQFELEREGQPKLADGARDVADLLQTAVSQAHDLARGLVPVQLGVGGLTAALEDLAVSTTRRLGVRCSFHPSGGLPRNADDVKMRHLYRIAQEAVNNAAKHAHPRHIEVALSSNSAATILSVTDDGVGLSRTSRNGQGLGMSIMKYRSGLIGGEFLVEEPSTGGTVVSCSMNIANEQEAYAPAS